MSADHKKETDHQQDTNQNNSLNELVEQFYKMSIFSTFCYDVFLYYTV